MQPHNKVAMLVVNKMQRFFSPGPGSRVGKKRWCKESREGKGWPLQPCQSAAQLASATDFFCYFTPYFCFPPPLPPLAHPKVCFDLKQGQDLARGGDSHTKETGMLVFSLRAVNCRFWSHLGCLGWKVTILAHPGIAKKFAKHALTLTTQKYPFKIEVSLSLNSLNHTYIGLP